MTAPPVNPLLVELNNHLLGFTSIDDVPWFTAADVAAAHAKGFELGVRAAAWRVAGAFPTDDRIQGKLRWLASQALQLLEGEHPAEMPDDVHVPEFICRHGAGGYAPGLTLQAVAASDRYSRAACLDQRAICLAESAAGSADMALHLEALAGASGPRRAVIQAALDLAGCRARRGKQWADGWQLAADAAEDAEDGSR